MNGHASIPIYLHTFRFPVLVVPGCATSAPSFHLVSAPPDGLSSSMLRRSSPTPPSSPSLPPPSKIPFILLPTMLLCISPPSFQLPRGGADHLQSSLPVITDNPAV
ncbi:hypothetical protein I7I50_00368 [Histoplasma capsulatum G186AR]|nr:hypothetical protein I7I50_00368 [Histoplasma capsulatum G186AR]